MQDYTTVSQQHFGRSKAGVEVMDLEVAIAATLEEATRQMADSDKFCCSTWAALTGTLALRCLIEPHVLCVWFYNEKFKNYDPVSLAENALKLTSPTIQRPLTTCGP